MDLITRPLTLALRLFGNIFAGEILVEKLTETFYLVVPSVWLLMSVVIGAIQAYIFTVLSLAYTVLNLDEELNNGGLITLVDLNFVTVLVIGLICSGASIAAAFSDSKVVSTALESIARQPEVEGALFRAMLIGIGLIESIPIIAIVIGFILLGRLG